MQCPKCGNEMWDNRETKKNPKAPDYKCKDRTCDGVVWPPKGQKVAPKAPQAQGTASTPKWTWVGLGKTYERALLTAEMRVLACAERLGTKATVADVLQATATVFIEIARNGVAEPKAKLPPKPAPDAEEPEDEDYGEPLPY